MNLKNSTRCFIHVQLLLLLLLLLACITLGNNVLRWGTCYPTYARYRNWTTNIKRGLGGVWGICWRKRKWMILSLSLLPDLRSPPVRQTMGTQSLRYLLMSRQNWGEKQSYLCNKNVPGLSPAWSHTERPSLFCLQSFYSWNFNSSERQNNVP